MVYFGPELAQEHVPPCPDRARQVFVVMDAWSSCTERAPTIVAARPALPVPLGRGRATLTPFASLYLTPHASMFLPLAPCLPWWCPAPCLPGGAPGCRRCCSSGLLPPKPSALSASCSPTLPCSNVLHLLRRVHADALAGRSRSEADVSLPYSLYEEEEGPTCKRETSPRGFLQN
jgi:hypothetical protein